jgi:hypothetical protein
MPVGWGRRDIAVISSPYRESVVPSLFRSRRPCHLPLLLGELVLCCEYGLF